MLPNVSRQGSDGINFYFAALREKPNLIFTWRYSDESTGMAPGARRVRAGFFSHSRNGALLLDQNVSRAGANLSLAARPLCSPATQQLAASGRQLSGVRREATHFVPRV